MEYEILAEQKHVFLFKLGEGLLGKEMSEWRTFINMPTSSQVITSKSMYTMRIENLETDSLKTIYAHMRLGKSSMFKSIPFWRLLLLRTK